VTGVVVLLVLVGVGGWFLVSQQYYVGLDGEQVVIYRGVDASLGPVELARVAERTQLGADDVPAWYRAALEDGVTAADINDARRIVANAPRRETTDENGDGDLIEAPDEDDDPADDDAGRRRHGRRRRTVSSDAAATRASGARAAEARLLVFAIGLTLFAGLLLGFSAEGETTATAFVTAGALAVIAGVAHLTIRSTARDADPTVLPLTVLLNGLGLVLVRRVDLATGSDLAVTQTVWTAVSVGGMCALLLFIRQVRDLGRYQYTFGLATIVLLLLPLVPGLTAGVINGAQLWIDLFGMRFQPGEVAKLTMVVFLAGYLERKRALLSVANQRFGPLLLPAPRHLAPVLLAAFMALVIMAGLRDLGSALLFYGAFLAVLYVATGRPAYPALGGVAFAIGAFIAYHLFGHVRIRVRIWLDPWADVTGTGYQLAQSLFAIGTGGLTGTGLGQGGRRTCRSRRPTRSSSWSARSSGCSAPRRCCSPSCCCSSAGSRSRSPPATSSARCSRSA
jgi:hypothetical protein